MQRSRNISGTVILAAAGTFVMVVSGCGGSGRPGQVQTGAQSGTTPPVVSGPVNNDRLPSPSVLPISQEPTGPFGSAGNPLGSPRSGVSTCGVVQSTDDAIDISIANDGFGSSCYHLPMNTAVQAVFTNNAVNVSTGLPIASEVVISAFDRPVVAQENRSASVMPGLTIPSDPIPVLSLDSALFTSPTAADSNPVSFVIPPLSAGVYLLQIPTLPTAKSAVLRVGGSATPSPAEVVTSAPTTSSTGVEVGTPSATDEAALASAFSQWEHLPDSCPAVVVPGSALVATVSSTRVQWALAHFAPAPSCSYSLAPPSPGGTPRPVDPNLIGPFAEPQPPVGIFQRSGGQNWIMDEEGGDPFPCPAPDGDAPGPGNGALPASVLSAWNMSYAPNCAFVSYPPPPR